MPTDLHAHVVPSDLLRRLRDGPVGGVELIDAGARGVGLSVAGRSTPAGPSALTDVGARLAAMDAAGVRRQVLSCWVELLATRLPPRDAVVWTRAVNDAMATEVAAHPDRLDALGTVPLQAPDQMVGELRRLVEDLGLAGVELPTTVAGTEFAALDLGRFWAAAEALRAVVLLHPVDPLGRDRTAESGLVDLVSSPAETATAVGHLLRAGVLERHPALRLVLVHGGGALPWLVGRAAAVGRARGDGALAGMGAALRLMHHDSLVHDPRVLRLLIAVVGADRVVLGTDWPFPHGEADPVGAAREALARDPAALEAVLRGNAERLLAGVRRFPRLSVH